MLGCGPHAQYLIPGGGPRYLLLHRMLVICVDLNWKQGFCSQHGHLRCHDLNGKQGFCSRKEGFSSLCLPCWVVALSIDLFSAHVFLLVCDLVAMPCGKAWWHDTRVLDSRVGPAVMGFACACSCAHPFLVARPCLPGSSHLGKGIPCALRARCSAARRQTSLLWYGRASSSIAPSLSSGRVPGAPAAVAPCQIAGVVLCPILLIR